MGKATRWLKGLLHSIKSPDPNPSTHPPPKVKRRWSFVKSYRDKPPSSSSSAPAHAHAPAADEASKHAIVVAAASAAAAEAAVAAAQAAAAVVRLTRHAPPSAHVSVADHRQISAALLIQSHFRGYLARRALRALKGLVKLQALVRGHIMRKKTAETMRSIQAMLRAQARARSVRSYDSPNSSGKCSQIHHPGPPTPEKFGQTFHTRNMSGNQSAMLKGNGSRSVHRVLIHPDNGYVNSAWSGPQLGESMWATQGRYVHHGTAPCCSAEDYYVRPDKILEVDNGKPHHFGPRHRKSHFESRGPDFGSDQLTQSFTTTTSKDSTTYPTTVLSPASCEVQSGLNMKSLKLSVQEDDDDGAFCTAENSPRFYSSASRGGSASSRRRGQHTPTKSDASATSCFSGYSDCPSYMSYTESSRAKMRSMSAPRQRPQPCYERASSTKRWGVHPQRVVGAGSSSSAAMHASFASKAYPGSGRLDRLGMPVRSNAAVVYYSGYLN